MFSNLSAVKQLSLVTDVCCLQTVYAGEKAVLSNAAMSPEDVEAFQIERERTRDLLEGYCHVERIIDQQIAPPSRDIPREHGV